MSLRPDDSGRSGRSRSRNRDSARAPSPMDKDYFRRKDPGRGDDNGERSVKMVAPPASSLPGAFKEDSGSDGNGKDDEEQPRPRQYQVYEPRATASNVSSRAPPSNVSARMPDLPDRGLMYGGDSDEGSDDEERRQSFSRKAGISGSGNMYAGGSPGQGMPYPQEVKYMPQVPVNQFDSENSMAYYQAAQYSHAAPSAYQYAEPPENITYSAKEQVPKREDRYKTKRDSPTRSGSHRLSYSYAEPASNGKSKGDSSVIEPPSGRLRGDSNVIEPPSGRLRGDSSVIEPPSGRSRGDSNAVESSGLSRLKSDAAALENAGGRSRGDSNVNEPSGRKSRGDSNSIIQPPGSSSSSRYAPVAEPDEYANGKLSKTDSKKSHRVSFSSPSEQQYSVRAPPGASLAPDGAGGGSKRSNRLSVSGNRPDVQGFGGGHLPPASPLLEAYKGTYQTASPMPSPMMLPADLDDIPALEPLSSEEESEERRKSGGGGGKRRRKKKSVKLYDAEGDAETLAKALKHRDARTEPLIDILPELTHDQLLHLRDEYKKMVKIQGRGVNIAKQIKMGTTGNFGKAAYVTALGRWESEAHWANFWYQSRTSSRELLIEALMGRTNAEMREIKAAFKDKRYDDSLSRCMEKELKADKFRMAVLLALEARRQEETDTMPVEYRNQDVDMLHRAISSREGGESAILQIVVTRSDNHLREVLKTYERLHQTNFAREALRKSNNLVGEVIAHILNGVINRVARDCLLLHHAIDDITTRNKAVEFRYELLMSRLIRLHWDRLHLGRVKDEYRSKYGVSLEREIKEATKNDFGAFCLKLASG